MKVVSLVLWLLCLLPVSVAAQVRPHDAQDGSVLVISSYFPFKESGNRIIASFTETFAGQSDRPVVVEYMDSEATAEFDGWRDWMHALFEVYVHRPAVVVIFGNEAWLAYRACYPERWADVPVVLGGVKNAIINYEDHAERSVRSVSDLTPTRLTFGPLQVTGYFIRDYFAENLALIRRLEPGGTQVACIYDDRYQLGFFPPYMDSIARQAGFARLHYWSGAVLSTGDLIDSIARAGDRCALLMLGWYTDADRYPHSSIMFYNELGRTSSRCLYQVLDEGFSSPNTLGGYFVSGEDIGRDAAQLTLSVLGKGIAASPPFGPTPSPPRYYLNYPTLIRAGIDPDSLPAGTVLFDRPLSLFEQYTWELILIASLVVAVVLLLAAVQLARKRREEDYRRTNERMKKLIASMPDMAVIYDAKQNIVDLINPQSDVAALFNPRALIGRNIRDLGKEQPAFAKAGAIITDNVVRTALTGKMRNFRYSVRTPEAAFYAQARAVPYENDQVIVFVHNITSHIEAERQIVKLQVFLQSIVNNLPVGLYVKNATDDFRYLFYNRKAAEFFDDRDPAAVLGKTDFELGDPLAEAYLQDARRAVESDVPLTFDRFRYDDQGCVIRSGVATMSKLVNNDGSCYVITVLTDTTELRRQEQEIESARRRLSLAIDAGALAAWTYDVPRQWFCSLHNETLSGDGMTLGDTFGIVHPEDAEAYREMIDRLVSGRQDKTQDVLRFRKDGKYDWYEFFAVAIRDPEGRVVQLIGTEKNITPAIEAKRKLTEYIVRSDLVISSGGIILWDYDVASGIFSSPDPSSFMHEGMGQQDFMSLVVPEDVPEVKRHLAMLVRGEVEKTDLRVKVDMPGKGVRWVEIHAVVCERDARGRVSRISGLRKDYTDLKNMAEEMMVLRDKAEESSRLKSAFLANMSHEIRTPLNAIVGFSNLIIQTDDPEERGEYSKIIETNNELLLQLINDILDLSKIEAGQMEFNYGETDICQVFRTLEQIYTYRVKPGVSLACELPDESCVIHTEKNRLTQVVSNFLSNAVKFTSEGSITMGYSHLEGGIRFYVTDTGKGIARENLDRVFTRFMKFDSFVPGTGLGLSICETIVKRLEGEIGVESELGRGATFWFTLPVRPLRCDEAAPQAAPETAPLSESPESARQRTLLVAEDNDSNYLLLSSILKKEYRLVRALDGGQAVELHAGIAPDLILMDIRMPKMDGLEATRRIRETDARTPIVALTANAFDEDRSKATDAGCNAYITKPVNVGALLALLKQLL